MKKPTVLPTIEGEHLPLWKLVLYILIVAALVVALMSPWSN
jgi:hypothetical protein